LIESAYGRRRSHPSFEDNAAGLNVTIPERRPVVLGIAERWEMHVVDANRIGGAGELSLREAGFARERCQANIYERCDSPRA
jgi:hypothetical protein